MKRRSQPPVVAMVSDAIHPYHRGGKEIRYHVLSHELSRIADVDLYTMNWWGGPRTIRSGDVRIHALCRLHPLYSKQRRSIAQAVWFAAASLSLLFRRFDVLEADHMPYIQLFPLRVITWIRGKRLVVTWHEVWGREYWENYAGRVGLLGAALERFSMMLPDHIIAASSYTADRLRPIVGDKTPVTVAPNGVDIAVIDAARAAAETYDVVTAGRLIGHKRVDLLLQAVARLREDGCPIKLLIIGTGPDERSLRGLATSLGLDESVTIRTDVVDQTELYGLMKASRLFVSLSEREGFGIAVLEALACGLRVVTTSAPDNLSRHLVREARHGYICAPGLTSVVEAIRVGLAEHGDAPACRELGTDLDRWVRQYDWSTIASTVAEALHIPQHEQCRAHEMVSPAANEEARA